MRVTTFVAAVVLLVIRGAIPAWADVIVVISDDPAFRAASGVALAPAGIDVRLASDPAPAIAELADQSRTIADREHASATVWLLFVDHGATLIVYDRGVDRVLVRSLPYTAPLADAHATEAARITGTMLRALREVGQPRPPPKPAVDRERPQPQIVVVAPAPPRLLGIELDGGVRVRGPGATAVPAGALGAIWRPDRVGLALTARLAPSADVDMLEGRISDQSLALTARWPLAVTPRLAVVTTGGVALHRIALDGTVAGTAVHDRRYDPAARVGLAGSYALGPSLGIGLAVCSDVLLRRQAYDVGDSQAVSVPRIQLSAGLSLIARIL